MRVSVGSWNRNWHIPLRMLLKELIDGVTDYNRLIGIVD
jgi:hypothetical protein